MNSLVINNTKIDSENPVYIIAEIGIKKWRHEQCF